MTNRRSAAPSQATAARTARGWPRRLLPLAVLAALAALALALGLDDHLSLQELAAHRRTLKDGIAAHPLPAIGCYLAVYVTVVALSLPGGAVLTVAGGLLFGWLIGGIATVFAATTGAIIIFAVARTSLGEPLAARAGPWLARLRCGFRENALIYMLFLRLVPAFPFWLVNLAPAFLGVRMRDYAIGTFVGIIPGTFAYAFAGAGLDSVLDAQHRAYLACEARRQGGSAETCSFSLDAGALITPELLIAFAALGLAALIPVFVKKLRKNPGKAA